MPYIILNKGKSKGHSKTMGLSSSQTRLLSITSRMHDIELQAQHVMNEKVLLATQEDEAYREYCLALDAKKIQVRYGKSNYVDATFDNICNFDASGNRNCEYALTDAETGKMIVNNEVYITYDSYKNDKYSFAWAMLGFSDTHTGSSGDYSDFTWDHVGGNLGNNVGMHSGSDGNGTSGQLMSEVEEMIYKLHEDDTELSSAYEQYEKASADEKGEALENFRKVLYSNDDRKAEIYALMRIDKGKTTKDGLQNPKYLYGMPEDFDDTMSREFDYYVHLFEGIQNAGGCISVTDFSKEDTYGSEWFYNVVSSGRALLSMYNQNNSDKGWTETSIATSVSENYLQEVEDESLQKKAEVKYDHELDVINRKDSKYDQELENLENERTALKTEKESIDKVINDNIERTFNITS